MHKAPWRLTVSLLLFVLATTGMAAEPLQQDAGPDGLVCVEAEHYDNKVDIGTNVWELVTTAAGFTAPEGFSGGQAMQIMPDTPLGGRSVTTNFVQNSPRLDFQVRFVKTGTHYFSILAFGRDGNSDSAHIGLDGKAFDTSDNLSGWNAQYRWRGTTMEGPAGTFEVDTVGVHTLNVYMREDGLAFDKILVTTNPSYTPTGHGPAESSRGIPAYATGPVPSDTATDIPRDVAFSWTSGPSATAHDVYFGMVQADVADASRTDPRGVLVSQAQNANTYEPAARLELGTTYYWRIDEVGADLVKGNVWSFTTEPFTYRLTGITATASSFDEGAGPENTVNNSGMNAGNQHSTANTAMWLSSQTGPQPAWIQYEFNGVYKLHEMRVWNHNILFTSILGFGFKDVLIEYSTDGTTWSVLSDSTEFAQAPGADNYAHNTTVDFGGAAAKFVRLTAKSNWSGVMPQFGLSEVRFWYVPASPRQPQPASGATGLDVDTILSWRAGREAASHQVYFGTDQQAVTDGTAAVSVVADSSFDPGPLDLGTSYYWRVAEVNEAETPNVWEGPVWSFSTKQYAVVDDFEAYNDDDNRIYDGWIDGITTKASGSIIGYLEAPFAEKAIIHGGKQAMPFEYNNVGTPYFSEGERQWDTAQNWTANGADTLTLFFRGNPVGFLEPAPGSVTMSGGGADIWNAADEFRFAFKPLNGNGTLIAKVESLGNTDPWAKAGVMIRETLDPGSRFAAVYATPGQGVRYQARLITGGAATSDTATATAQAPEQMTIPIPVWIKIERTASNFSCFYSTDGAKWTAMVWNPQTINMGTNVYIGLAVTSHTTAAMTTAQFSSISATGATGAWQVQAIGPVQRTNDPAPLYVTVQDSAGKSKTISHPDPSATLLSTWQEWRIPLGEFSAAGVKMTGVKKLIIGAGDRSSPKAGGAGLLYIDDIGVGRPVAGQ